MHSSRQIHNVALRMNFQFKVNFMQILKHGLAIIVALSLFGCQASKPPIAPVSFVDIPKFMGDWYVIANIPTFVEEGAHNAIESYKLKEDGSIQTTFTFHQDSFDGELKTYKPVGYVEDHTTNALWGMQFIWPIKADYRIIYLTDDYSQTIIARNKRDYVWIMARTPHISDEDYQHMLGIIEKVGYDISKVKRVPQKWPTE